MDVLCAKTSNNVNNNRPCQHSILSMILRAVNSIAIAAKKLCPPNQPDESSNEG
jgi:hypothetical protein